MKNFSYSLTPTITTNLQTIELLRRDILSTPLSPKIEMKLRFDALVSTIQGIHAFSGIQRTKNDIIRDLMSAPTNHNINASTILKRTLVFITYEWSMNTKPVSYGTLETIATLLAETPKIGSIYVSELSERKAQLKDLITFLETSKDHPIVTALVAFLESMAITPLGTKTAHFCFMLLFLYLHKYGYDLRQSISILPYWTHDIKTFQYTLVEAQTSGNFSKFIDFAIQQFVSELTQKREIINNDQLRLVGTAALFTLTDRQKEILSLMDDPSTSITNRAVKKRFNISQITASRDLARLAALGLLYPHGKGRSVNYTKV